MGQPPHFDIEGSIYFITTRLKGKGQYLNEYESEIIQRTILDMAFRKELILYAYVIMPNHTHLLVKPINQGISKTMQLLKGRASRQINIHREAEASPTLNNSSRGVITRGRDDFSRPMNVWQKGFFDFTIITDEKFREKFNYIHYNPVKWGLTGKAEDYKYSSAKEYKVKYGEVSYE
jgi:putative transposase